MRFDTWTVPSRSAILPWGFSWDFLRWRLIIATPSTTARFLLARISRTLPCLPLWEPEMTTTWSLRLMWNFWDMLQDLRSEGDDLGIVLGAELAGDRPEDAGALRIAVLANDDDGVRVEAQVAAVGATQR